MMLTAGTDDIEDGDGLTNVSYTYQWLRAGAEISGATNSTYTLTSSDQEGKIQVKVDFTDDANNPETRTSDETLPVAPAAAVCPTDAATVWCTTLTVGRHVVDGEVDESGFEARSGRTAYGSVNGATFRHLGVDYTVTALYGGGIHDLVFSTTPNLPSDGAGLTVHVQTYGGELDVAVGDGDFSSSGYWIFEGVLYVLSSDPLSGVPLIRKGFDRSARVFQPPDSGTEVTVRLSYTDTPGTGTPDLPGTVLLDTHLTVKHAGRWNIDMGCSSSNYECDRWMDEHEFDSVDDQGTSKHFVISGLTVTHTAQVSRNLNFWFLETRLRDYENENLVLMLDGEPFPFSEADAGGYRARQWRNTGLSWNAGGTDSPGSTVVAETGPAQRSSADEELTAPARELPGSTVVALRIEWSRLWGAFRHDVNVLTNSLMYVPEGIHSRHLAEWRRVGQAVASTGGTPENLEQAMRAFGEGYAAPTYPKLQALPLLIGEPLFRRTAPDGPMERLAFKGWLREVYYMWERHYRNQLKHEARHLPGAVHPRLEVLGDRKDIRNDLVHKGIARRGKAADCKILRWFTQDEEIQIRMRHVLDFLNQMGWLSESAASLVQDGGRSSSWHIDREGEIEKPTPQMISVRPVVDPLHQDPRYRYGVCVAFENGVFGATPTGPEREEMKAQAQTRMDRWMKTVVNGAGDLEIPDLGTVPAAELYADYLKGERGRGPGIWGPWVQFRE